MRYTHGMQTPKVTEKQRAAHLDWLKEITTIPTAAGCEGRVVAWVEDWLSHRDYLESKRDKAGNLVISGKSKSAAGHAPIFITAHLDHPAFVVKSIKDDLVVLDFRGGVNDPYFVGAKIEIIDSRDLKHRAVIESLNTKTKPFKRVTAPPDIAEKRSYSRRCRPLVLPRSQREEGPPPHQRMR